MSDFVGVINLEKTIPCLKEVSGKTFKSRIAGREVKIVFPSIPKNYGVEPQDFINGELVVPGNIFEKKVRWGTINAWPAGLFSVDAFLCYTCGETSDIEEIYEQFPCWKAKIHNLILIDTGNYLQPEQKTLTLIQGGGFNDGLRFFRMENEQPQQYIINSHQTEPIRLQIIESKDSYSVDQLTKLFAYAGSEKEIVLPYELLIAAYRAMERHDFRSAVVLGGTAVEQAALKRLKKEYSSNRQFRRDKSKTKYSTLGGKFRWLSDMSVSIPVPDYKETIIDVRNDATHDGIRPSYNKTKICLENCKILIEEYNPNILEI